MTACHTELDCISCGQTTDHMVVYASSYIKRIRCQRCHYTLEQSTTILVRHYYHDLPIRSIALTRRLKNEAQNHPLLFALSLPRRAVSKPIDLVREYADLYFA